MRQGRMRTARPPLSFAVRPDLVPGPVADAAVETGADVGVMRGDVGLLVGIGFEVEERGAVGGGVKDVLEAAFAHAEQVGVLGAVEVGAVGVGGAEQAVALPG